MKKLRKNSTKQPRSASRRISPELLRRLIDGSNLAIQIYRLEDRDDLGSFRFVYTNAAAAAQVGIPYADLCADIGKSFRESVPDLLSTEAPARYRQVLETGVPDTFELRYGDAKYPSMVLRVYAWPIDTDTITLAFTNVTVEHETQRHLDENMLALQRAYEDLEASRSRQVQVEKLASLGQMSAGVAHEINNPLMVVKGYTEQIKLLLKSETLTQRDKLEQFIVRIERNIARIETIADRMSSYSRQAGRATTTLRLNAVIRESVELVRPELSKLNVELVIDLCSQEPEIVANELRLEQLIVNLLLNARDAVVGVARPARIEISSRCDRSSVRLDISDNGTGMSSEVQQRMFDPFFSTKPPGAGTGLGLSIVHEIAQELGGSITCETTLGAGSRFSLLLPPVGSEASTAPCPAVDSV